MRLTCFLTVLHATDILYLTRCCRFQLGTGIQKLLPTATNKYVSIEGQVDTWSQISGGASRSSLNSISVPITRHRKSQTQSDSVRARQTDRGILTGCCVGAVGSSLVPKGADVDLSIGTRVRTLRDPTKIDEWWEGTVQDFTKDGVTTVRCVLDCCPWPRLLLQMLRHLL